MPHADAVQLESLILNGDISMESHLPLIRNILNDEYGGHLMLNLKSYFQLIVGGYSRFWEYLHFNDIRIIHSNLLSMYRQYDKYSSSRLLASGQTDILIFSFQGNVSECLPKFSLCNTRLVPKFAGSGICRELISLGYNTSLISFRDCVQLWYEDEFLSKSIISEINSSILTLSPKFVVFLGSSAGGYAALKYFNLSDVPLPFVQQEVIVSGPQFDVFCPGFMRPGENYRQSLWACNGSHPLTLKRYWRKTDSCVSLFFGNNSDEDCYAAEQIAEISSNLNLIPIDSKDHAPARKKDFLKQIIKSFHQIG